MPKGAEFERNYQLLYSVAQAPGVLMPIFSGSAVDKFGASICLLVLSSTCLMGQIVSSFGVQHRSWWIVITGRFVFGLGFEALFATNQAFLVSWFSTKEIGFALGISSAMSYVGFLLSFVISPASANYISTASSFWIGATLMSASVLASIAAHLMDRWAETQLLRSQHSASNMDMDMESSFDGEAKSYSSSSVQQDDQGSYRSRCHMPNFPSTFWLVCCLCLTIYGVDRTFIDNASGLMLERNLFVEPPKDCRLNHPEQCPSGYLSPVAGNPQVDGNNMSCPESISFISYALVWPESLNITNIESESEQLSWDWEKSTYVFDPMQQSDINCSDPFFSEACTQAYCQQKDQSTETAGFLMTIPYIVTICTTFIFGHFCVDKYGWPVEMLCLAPALLGMAHLLLLLQRGSLIPALVLEGLGFSIGVSALLPSVAIVVDESVSGLAFGLYTSIQNLGLAILPLIVASIYSYSGQYLPEVELLIIALAALGVLFGMLLMYVDKRSGSRLHSQVRSQL